MGETNVFSSPEFADIFEEEFSKEEVGDRSYGIVLQSVKRNPLVDGCYILRTSTSRSVGCQCTHYSMSRALCGSDGTCMTVEQQVDQSWLVNPFTLCGAFFCFVFDERDHAGHDPVERTS